MNILTLASVQEVCYKRCPVGPVLYIKIRRHDYKEMTWTEVWEVFQDRYPNRWAIQVFPPKDRLVDEENIYHLYVLEEGDSLHELDICWRR